VLEFKKDATYLTKRKDAFIFYRKKDKK